MVSNELIDGERVQHASTVEHRYQIYIDMWRWRGRERETERESEKRAKERERERYESWPAEPHAMQSLLRFLSVKSPGSE